MTPQDEELIAQLFSRLKEASTEPQDPDADRLISRGIAEQPKAPYLLVQTVLIQDMALNQAQQRIAELENQLAEVRAARPAQPPQVASFLGRALGRGSVPATGPWERASPDLPPGPQPAPAPGWSQVAAPPPAGMMPGAGSGFLQAAATTALGVAGGQLLFQGIESMFGHRAGGMLAGQPAQQGLSETITNNYYGDQNKPSAATDSTSGAAAPDDVATDHTADNTLATDDNTNQDADDLDLDGSDIDSDDDFDGSDTDLI
jgi:uncharacterized protein